MGEDAARKLVADHPGVRTHIPNVYPELSKGERNLIIKNRFYSGWTTEELANEFEISKSQIYKILNK